MLPDVHPRHPRSHPRTLGVAGGLAGMLASVALAGAGATGAQAAPAAAAPAPLQVVAADPEPVSEPPTEPEPQPEPEPASLTVTVPAQSRSDVTRSTSVSLADADGAPVADRAVQVQVRTPAGDWLTQAELVTGADGAATGAILVPRAPAQQRWRAVLVQPGDAAAEEPAQALTSSARSLDLVPWQVRLRRTGPDSVVDGRRLRQVWAATTRAGAPVPNATVVIRSRIKGKTERRILTTGARGRVVVRERPRWDSRWAARVRPGTWHEGAAAPVATVDNLPAGPVVVLPADAPRPKLRLPAQPRAFEAGPNPKVTRIPDRVWREMNGVTWRPGCPVGRSNLRLIRVNYWAYDGYARRGEIVVNAATAYTVASTFADIYRSRLPIRSMYRVDRFGYSARVNGGDDFASMDAGNTSGFNCRNVVNYSARSPHAYGFAIDINTWENPYRSRQGIVPNVYWQYRSHPLVAWRSSSHPMVALLYRHGWSWPYGLGDTQHFSAPARGRYAPAARAAEDAEHLLEHASSAAEDARGHRDHTGYVPGTDVPLE